jgi:hypothetical protein
MLDFGREASKLEERADPSGSYALKELRIEPATVRF